MSRVDKWDFSGSMEVDESKVVEKKRLPDPMGFK